MSAESDLATGPSNVFALEVLHDSIKAIFAESNIPCEFAFGWREPNRQGQYPAANITMAPGDPQGAFGEVTGARFPGQIPARPVAGVQELFTVTIQAFDAAAPQDERAQYRAARRLYDHWLRALYLSDCGNWVIRSQAWITAKNERRFGAGLRVVGGILAVVPDLPVTTAPVDTKAQIAESLNSTLDEVVEIVPDNESTFIPIE